MHKENNSKTKKKKKERTNHRNLENNAHKQNCQNIFGPSPQKILNVFNNQALEKKLGYPTKKSYTIILRDFQEHFQVEFYVENYLHLKPNWK